MKWILIVITFWRPDVTVSQVELEFATEQECLDQQYLIEAKYAEQKNTGFGYMLYCIQKDELRDRLED